MDFSSHISPFTMTSEANGLPPVMARMLMKVSSGIATRTALPALSQQRVVFPVTGNPHVIHKQGDSSENGFVSMAVRYTAAACFRLGLHAGTKFSSASTDSRNNARRHVPVPL